MAEQALVGRDPDPGTVHLASARFTPKLPGQFADLGDRLRRHRFTEGPEAAGRVDWQPAPDLGDAIPQQLLGLAFGAEAQLLVPVQLEARRKVVDLRDVHFAEVYDPFTGAEIQGIEALGLAGEGEGGAAMADGAFDADGPLPVNLSGGLIGQGGAPGASGIAQAVAVDRLLRGAYWPGAQPGRELRRGVVDTHGGICTTSVVHVLERAD